MADIERESEESLVVNNGTSVSDILSTDGLLSQEQEELVDRVAYLEKKVRKQEDEIICLKTALSDVIRRLGVLEASQNNILPSKTKPYKINRKSYPSTDRKSHLNALENVNLVPHRGSSSSSPRPHHKSSNHLKKWGSLSNSADLSNTSLTSSRSPTRRSFSHSNLSQRPTSHRGSREPNWNQAEGYLKVFLKGRGVALYAPSDLTDFDVGTVGEAPNEKLQLEWVYGYRGRDCRSNLYHLPTGEIIYFIAATVVLYNVEEGMQRHYNQHTDDVKCIAIHPDKVKIATGQVAGHEKKEGRNKRNDVAEIDDHLPHVRIWDSVSLNTLHIIGLGDFERAVCCVSFSKLDGGQQLVCVDDANEHVISVWDISRDKPHKVTETKSSTEPVLAAEYHPYENNQIVMCGKGQISFWTLESGTLTKKQGIYEKMEKPKFVLCLAFAENGDVLSGDSNGNIFVWGRGTNRISHAVNGAHDGGVFSLCVMKDGTILSGGGKDRKVYQFDENYKRTGLETEISEEFGPVRTLSQGHGNLILVGTTRNSILQGTLDLKLNPIVYGHLDELWGLAPHPSQHQFMSCGSDKHVYLWDSMSHSVVWSKEITDPAHSCCFHPEGNIAVVGTHNARWLVIDLNTHDIITAHTDGNEQIECLQFSPDGKYLAVGSRDNYIYLYQVSDGGTKYTKVGRCSGHSSFITHVDWSEDGQYLVSNSGDYEVLYWTTNCRQVTSPDNVRNVQWATQTCTLGFNVAGIWPEGADGTDVNTCGRTKNHTVIASGDDFGKVNLYKYPCCKPRSSCHSYKAHSSHVTAVNFLFDDSRLITAGGRDMAIMQWELI
ncbi:echinoderm microtubule-associated protein-like 2 isoform X5 [Patella vulgata]|uniref:echinoderm microtubule-associated protein-like 2 isoform X5 n=1 Tax=Patella vulgata TaxID=6465 RepID=UPI00218001B8|nr:echinoderm microtubule-associated protein-like 2 isoform X5 [Patella vulgata]